METRKLCSDGGPQARAYILLSWLLTRSKHHYRTTMRIRARMRQRHHRVAHYTLQRQLQRWQGHATAATAVGGRGARVRAALSGTTHERQRAYDGVFADIEDGGGPERRVTQIHACASKQSATRVGTTRQRTFLFFKFVFYILLYTYMIGILCFVYTVQCTTAESNFIAADNWVFWHPDKHCTPNTGVGRSSHNST